MHARLLTLVLLFGAVGGCAAKTSHTAANASQAPRRAGEARVAAAQTMLDALEKRYMANEPLTPDFLDA